MTDRKWTKGPWHVSQRTDDQAAYITEKPCGKGRVAKVWMGRSAQDANAHLISAAPDLYDALDMCEKFAGDLNIEEWQQVMNALAKARGDK